MHLLHSLLSLTIFLASLLPMTQIPSQSSNSQLFSAMLFLVCFFSFLTSSGHVRSVMQRLIPPIRTMFPDHFHHLTLQGSKFSYVHLHYACGRFAVRVVFYCGCTTVHVAQGITETENSGSVEK